MPLVRPCEVGGCPRYAEPDERYCADHVQEKVGAERDLRRERNKRYRRSAPSLGYVARQRVYRDPRWAVARRQTLLRDGYTCLHCGAEDDLTVDHILGITGTDDDFDPEYLITLCRGCHGRKDGRRSATGTPRTGRREVDE